MTYTKADELKDSGAASVLVADREPVVSEQSGETFCWEPDGDPIGEFDRYRYYDDLYPEVTLRRRRGADGEYLPIDLGGDVVDSTPEHERIEYSLRGEVQPEPIRAIDHRIAIYTFRLNPDLTTPHFAPGTLVSQTESVTPAEMWEHTEGGDLPEWVYFIAEFNARWLGSPGVHSLAASVHPLEDVLFLEASPPRPSISPYRWHHLIAAQTPQFTFSGTGDHHTLRKTGIEDYAPWAAGAASSSPARVGANVVSHARSYRRTLLRRGTAPKFTLKDFLRSGWIQAFGGRDIPVREMNRTAIRVTAKEARRHLGVAVVGHVAASFFAGAAGYDIGTIRIIPVDTNGLQYPPSTITLVVGREETP